jgi:lauroyl/myristoyl acyltransferase
VRLLSVGDLYLASALALVSVAGWSRSRTAKERTAAAIGSIAYRLSVRKRRLTEEGLARAMPAARSTRERRAIVEASFREFWRETFSLTLSPSERSALAAVEVCGMAHLRAALGHGRGAILWESGFFGKRLIAKHILKDHGVTVRQVHAETHVGGFGTARGDGSVLRHALRRYIERQECRSVAGIIHISRSDSLAFTRVMQRWLREGAVVCTSSDGQFGRRFVVVPFLGHDQRFATGMVSLARTAGVPLLPMFCFDDPPGRVRLVIEPPMALEAGEGRDRATEEVLTRYARLLESYVRRYPGQYRGWHFLGEPART